MEVIYYLPDERRLDFVRFAWNQVSQRDVPAPVDFRTVPRSLLSDLERAQAHELDVFVDFWTDRDGGSAEVITIATLSKATGKPA